MSTVIEKKLAPIDAARKIAAIAIENRDETENSRRLAPPVVEQLKEHGLCRLGLPKSLGGWEDDPIEVLKTFEILSGAEAAVAWITWNNHLACTFGRFLDEESMQEIFGNEEHLYANSARPEGFAEETEGGYTINGKWTMVSGCELADWFALRCFVIKKGEPAKPGPGAVLKLFFIHKDDINIVDTWHVGGLKGTGSHDVKVENIFVPTKYAIDFESPVAIDNPYSRLPIGCINSAGNAAMALGLAKTVTNELVKMGLARVTPGSNPDLRDRPHIQASVANSLSLLSAVTLQLHKSVESIWNASLNEETYTDEQLADVWAASYTAATTARTILSDIFAVAGTVSLYSKFPIERAHRDIHAILQHGIIQPHWMHQAGMAHLGLKPTGAMFSI